MSGKPPTPASEAAGSASPDLVLLLNPDAEPTGDAIGQMARFLVEHPAAGGAGAQLQYPDGRFQHGAFAFPGLLQLWFDLFPPRPARLLDSRLNGRYPRSLYDAGSPFPIEFALGAALMVRREAIEAAGLLDEGYFMYAEEVDWCWRMRARGVAVLLRTGRTGDPSRRREHPAVSQPVGPEPVAEPAQTLRPLLRPAQTLCRGPDRPAGHARRRPPGSGRRGSRGEIDAVEERGRIETAEAVRRIFAQGEQK